jgi:hypothetical protein
MSRWFQCESSGNATKVNFDNFKVEQTLFINNIQIMGARPVQLPGAVLSGLDAEFSMVAMKADCVRARGAPRFIHDSAVPPPLASDIVQDDGAVIVPLAGAAAAPFGAEREPWSWPIQSEFCFPRMSSLVFFPSCVFLCVSLSFTRIFTVEAFLRFPKFTDNK